MIESFKIFQWISCQVSSAFDLQGDFLIWLLFFSDLGGIMHSFFTVQPKLQDIMFLD